MSKCAHINATTFASRNGYESQSPDTYMPPTGSAIILHLSFGFQNEATSEWNRWETLYVTHDSFTELPLSSNALACSFQPFGALQMICYDPASNKLRLLRNMP